MKIEPIDKKESIISSLVEEETKNLTPPGYIKVELSTKGRVGAPKKFHIRNFKTKDIMGLAITETEDLPERILEMMGDLIYEDDVDVYSFHEKEIIETLLILYHSFYSTSMEIVFPIEPEDLDYLRRTKPGTAERLIADLEAGRWVPTVFIDIAKDIETYDLPTSFKPEALIKSKETGFILGFRLPKFGDSLIIKNWIKSYFGEEEEKFSRIAKILDIQRQALERAQRGELVNVDNIPKVSYEDEEAFKKYNVLRTSTLIDMVRALHISNYDGEDVSGKTLSERFEIIQDPRIDQKIAKKLDNYFETLEFGLKPEVRMLNPITNEYCERRYSFRFNDVFKAIELSTDDEFEFISSV